MEADFVSHEWEERKGAWVWANTHSPTANNVHVTQDYAHTHTWHCAGTYTITYHQRLHRQNKIQWKFNSSTIKHHYFWLARHMPCVARCERTCTRWAGKLLHGMRRLCLSYLSVYVAFWTYYLLCELFMFPLARPQVLKLTVTMWQKMHTIYLLSNCTEACAHTHRHTIHSSRAHIYRSHRDCCCYRAAETKMFTFRILCCRWRRTVTVMRIEGSIYQHQFRRLFTSNNKPKMNAVAAQPHSTFNLVNSMQLN